MEPLPPCRRDDQRITARGLQFNTLNYTTTNDYTTFPLRTCDNIVWRAAFAPNLNPDLPYPTPLTVGRLVDREVPKGRRGCPKRASEEDGRPSGMARQESYPRPNWAGTIFPWRTGLQVSSQSHRLRRLFPSHLASRPRVRPPPPSSHRPRSRLQRPYS